MQGELLQRLVASLEGRTASPEVDGDIGETAKKRRPKKPSHLSGLSNGSVVLWDADGPLAKREDNDGASEALASPNSRTKFNGKGKGRDQSEKMGNGDAVL